MLALAGLVGTRRRTAGLIVGVGVLVMACSGERGPADHSPVPDSQGSGISETCTAYSEFDRELGPVLSTDSDEEVEAKFARTKRSFGAIVGATELSAEDSELADLANRVRARNDIYNDRYWSERNDAGGGSALSERAMSKGFHSTRDYIESLAFESTQDAQQDAALLRFRLAELCDEYAASDPASIPADQAPDGLVLAASLSSTEIHRFTTAGEDLGPLALPPELEGPIGSLTASPDGQRIAFLAGTENRMMWVIDMESGEATSSTPPTCMDWDTDSSSLWISADVPPNEFLALAKPDGSYEIESRMDLDGCPYRFDSSSLAVVRSEVDGAPPHVALLSKDGEVPEPLITSECALTHPQISPDASRLLLTVGCYTEPLSGVYVANSDGTGLDQVTTGTAAVATWSPDGEWFAFGSYSPTDPAQFDQTRVLISTADGSLVGALTPPGYSWPVWIPS